MVQSRREQIYSIDAKLYLYEDGYASFLNDLESILEEEVASFAAMPEGMQDSGCGAESRNAQISLQKAIKALKEVVDKKNRRKTQELMDEVHENLRVV